MTINDCEPDQIMEVDSLDGGPYGEGLLSRFRAMGIATGHPVCVRRRGWFGGPLVVRVGQTTEVAMRRSEATLITVRPCGDKGKGRGHKHGGGNHEQG